MTKESINQAFLNEYKGNLFEFLCAQCLAREFNLEYDFIKSVPPNFMGQLSHYESELRKIDPELPKKLIASASESTRAILKKYPEPPQSISVMGKINNAHKIQDDETDICLDYSNGKQLAISLKLCKSKSYVNTKSAGVKSFFEKYFSGFDLNNLVQDDLNNTLDIEYSKFVKDLYANHDLEPFDMGEVFDSQWKQNGFTELPGELRGRDHELLNRLYDRLRNQIFEACLKLYKENKVVFKESLLPLCGFTDPNIVQVKCYHKDHHVYKDDVKILSLKDLIDEEGDLEFMIDGESNTSFSISLGKLLLQIRIKPMNKFTAKSFKVNCSVKEF